MESLRNNPMGNYAIDGVENLTRSDSFLVRHVAARGAAVGAGAAVFVDAIGQAGAGVGDLAVGAYKTARNLVGGIALAVVGVLAPSYQAVVSRALGTSAAPIVTPAPKQLTRYERVKEGFVNTGKAIGHGVMHPIETTGKAVNVVRENPKTSMAVLAALGGLYAAHHYDLDTKAYEFGKEKGSKGLELANDYVATPAYNAGAAVVTGTAGYAKDAYNGVAGYVSSFFSKDDDKPVQKEPVQKEQVQKEQVQEEQVQGDETEFTDQYGNTFTKAK